VLEGLDCERVDLDEWCGDRREDRWKERLIRTSPFSFTFSSSWNRC
jgi:hypothetical protein